eukprot:m.232279 g.232279  ORF g.232279 m.232279 type:complete len:377 (+) comp18662_c0_seq1:88-1218(+)
MLEQSTGRGAPRRVRKHRVGEERHQEWSGVRLQGLALAEESEGGLVESAGEDAGEHVVGHKAGDVGAGSGLGAAVGKHARRGHKRRHPHRVHIHALAERRRRSGVGFQRMHHGVKDLTGKIARGAKHSRWGLPHLVRKAKVDEEEVEALIKEEILQLDVGEDVLFVVHMAHGLQEVAHDVGDKVVGDVVVAEGENGQRVSLHLGCHHNHHLFSLGKPIDERMAGRKHLLEDARCGKHVMGGRGAGAHGSELCFSGGACKKALSHILLASEFAFANTGAGGLGARKRGCRHDFEHAIKSGKKPRILALLRLHRGFHPILLLSGIGGENSQRVGCLGRKRGAMERARTSKGKLILVEHIERNALLLVLKSKSLSHGFV